MDNNYRIIDNYIRSGDKAHDEGNLIKALNYYLRAEELLEGERDIDLIISIALMLDELGDTEKAKEKYEEALYYLNKSVNTPAGSMLLDNEDFLTKYAISFYYTNDLINAKKFFKKLYKMNPDLKFINIYLKNINDRLSGKKRKAIPVIAITDSNYSTLNFKNKTKTTLSNIITKFKHNIAN